MKTLKIQRHTWVVTIIAVFTIAILVTFFPKFTTAPKIIAVGVITHFLMGLLAAFLGWLVIPETLIRRIWKRKSFAGYDFGWSPKWIYGYGIAGVIALMYAIYSYWMLQPQPVLQFVTFVLLFLLSINLFLGSMVMQSSNRTAKLTLPMVPLIGNENSKILDAGCGAGRTTLALANVYPNAQITAFDRFDAAYIHNGGKDLLVKNLKLAGCENRVTIEIGDITNTPFGENQFDAAVSSYMFDHLRTGKLLALKEWYRIVKPGGRCLLVLVTPGFSSFAIANVLSLLLYSKAKWCKIIELTGFKMVETGKINEGTYFFFEKPVASTTNY